MYCEVKLKAWAFGYCQFITECSYNMFFDGRYLYFTKIVAWENFSFALVLKLHQHGKFKLVYLSIRIHRSWMSLITTPLPLILPAFNNASSAIGRHCWAHEKVSPIPTVSPRKSCIVRSTENSSSGKLFK